MFLGGRNCVDFLRRPLQQRDEAKLELIQSMKTAEGSPCTDRFCQSVILAKPFKLCFFWVCLFASMWQTVLWSVGASNLAFFSSILTNILFWGGEENCGLELHLIVNMVRWRRSKLVLLKHCPRVRWSTSRQIYKSLGKERRKQDDWADCKEPLGEVWSQLWIWSHELLVSWYPATLWGVV